MIIRSTSIPEDHPPTDFVEFWERAIWSDKNPLNIQRFHFDTDDTHSHIVFRLSFDGANNTRIHGWYAIPRNVEPPFNGLLWLPAYGFNAHTISRHTTLPGFATFSINLLGNQPQHNEDYAPHKGYMTQGIESPETYIFRNFLISANKALDVLSQQPEVDKTNLTAGGLSQGGGLALWLSSITDKLKCAFCDMPFFISQKEYWLRTHYQYPYKEIVDLSERNPNLIEPIHHTLRYFDTLHFAPNVRCPIQVSCGTKDPKVRCVGVKHLYEILPEPKNLIIYEHGHEWVREMPDNNYKWVSQFIQTK